MLFSWGLNPWIFLWNSITLKARPKARPYPFRIPIIVLLGVLFILRLLAPIWPIQYTFWHSLCTNLTRTIGMPLCASFDISKALPAKDFFSLSTQTSVFGPTVIPIGPTTPLLVVLWPGILFLLGIRLYPENLKSSTPSPAFRLRPNIGPWLLPCVNLSGSITYSTIHRFLNLIQLPFSVTIKRLCTSLPIQYSINAKSILRLTGILLGINFRPIAVLRHIYPLKFNLPISLLKL